HPRAAFAVALPPPARSEQRRIRGEGHGLRPLPALLVVACTPSDPAPNPVQVAPAEVQDRALPRALERSDGQRRPPAPLGRTRTRAAGLSGKAYKSGAWTFEGW